jgi:hypothetical protein
MMDRKKIPALLCLRYDGPPLAAASFGYGSTAWNSGLIVGEQRTTGQGPVHTNYVVLLYRVDSKVV